MASLGHLGCFQKNMFFVSGWYAAVFNQVSTIIFQFFVKKHKQIKEKYLHSRRNALRIWLPRKRERKWLNSDLLFQAKMLELCHLSSVQKLIFLWKSLVFFYLSYCFSLQNKQFRCFVYIFIKHLMWIVKGIWAVSM